MKGITDKRFGMQEVAELEQTMATGFDEAGEAVKPAKVLEAVKGGLKGMAERRATAVGNRDDAAVAQLDQMRERQLHQRGNCQRWRDLWRRCDPDQQSGSGQCDHLCRGG